MGLNMWEPFKWTPEDVKAGVKVGMRNRGAAVIYRATWEQGDAQDAFILTSPDFCLYMPEIKTAAEMADFLNEKGYALWD